MENSDSYVEPEKQLSDLEEGDIVVLTTDPGGALLGKPASEKTARITLKLSNSFTVEHIRFSISSGKEMERVGSKQWRVVQDGWFISVPTAEQLERLPDPDGNYTDAQIRSMRKKAVESLLDRVREHLDLNSEEFEQRAFALRLALGDEKLRNTLVLAQGEIIKRLESENEDLKSKLKQLAPMLYEAYCLTEKFNMEVRFSL